MDSDFASTKQHQAKTDHEPCIFIPDRNKKKIRQLLKQKLKPMMIEELKNQTHSKLCSLLTRQSIAYLVGRSPGYNTSWECLAAKCPNHRIINDTQICPEIKLSKSRQGGWQPSSWSVILTPLNIHGHSFELQLVMFCPHAALHPIEVEGQSQTLLFRWQSNHQHK